MSATRTLAVVLTYNSEQYIDACVRSLEQQPDVTALVVDNGSDDRTLELVRQDHHDLRTVDTGDNLGYAGGNNVGLNIAIREAFEYCLLVNPDVDLELGCVDALVAALDADDHAAFASPVISYRDGGIWYAGSQIDKRWGTSWHDRAVDERQVRPTDRPSGAVVLVKLSAVRPIGLLDERFFLYYEETEWATRLAAEGFGSVVVRRARATHDVGHGQRGRSATYQYYMTRNHLLFASTSNLPFGWALVSSIRASVIALWDALTRSPAEGVTCAEATVKGYWDYARGRFGRQPTTWRPHPA